MSRSKVNALKAMLAELTSNKLEVILAPSKNTEIADRGGKIRVTLSQNADWYRRMCADYPSSRKRANRAPDTAIKRRNTVQALENLIKNKRPTSVWYEHAVLRYVPGFMKEQKKKQYREMLAMRKQKRLERATSFDPSTF